MAASRSVVALSVVPGVHPLLRKIEKSPQLEGHVESEPVVGILEICVDELERLGQVATERIAVHVSGVGCIVTPREVQGQLKHLRQVGSMGEVVTQEPAQAPVREILGAPSVESVAQQAIECEGPCGADRRPAARVRQKRRSRRSRPTRTGMCDTPTLRSSAIAWNVPRRPR